MRNNLILITTLLLAMNVFSQTAIGQKGIEMDAFVKVQNWDEVMMRSLDLITEEPMKPEGYYYTALVLYHRSEFDKAAGFADQAYLFGDDSWREKARVLAQRIIGLKKIIPASASPLDINSMKSHQWKELWEYDKTNISAGINAVELYIKEGYSHVALEVLDDPAFAKVPGVKELRDRLKADKNVAAANKIAGLVADGDALFKKQKYSEAKAAYEKALELDKNNREIDSKLRNVNDEEAWQEAVGANRVEAYEKYLNISSNLNYRDKARAKIIDYMRARIENFSKQNEMDKAEESFQKYVQQYRPGREEVKEFETLLCDLYSKQIYALSGGKSREDQKTRLDLFYKARRICILSEAHKKEILRLEKALK